MRGCSQCLCLALIPVIFQVTLADSASGQVQISGENACCASWSPNGTGIAFASRTGAQSVEIWTIPATGGTATQLTSNQDFDSTPSWSSGGQIAFESWRSGNPDIWVIPAAGGEASQITTDSARDSSPAWSPDGSQLAFASERSGNWDIWVMPATGGTTTQLTTHGAEDGFPAWSPDGSQIAFMSDRSGNPDIWVIPAAGGTAWQITTNSLSDSFPDWAPDGTRIAFTSWRSGNADVWDISVEGGTARQITCLDCESCFEAEDPGEDTRPSWSPDGTQIAFDSDRADFFGSIWILAVPAVPVERSTWGTIKAEYGKS